MTLITRKRQRFERRGGNLVDRTQSGHTTIIQETKSSDPTAEVSRRIHEGDFRDLPLLLSLADVGRVRPALLNRAEVASRLHPNLAQALALIGGAEAVMILRRNLNRLKATLFAALSQEEQQEAISVACALLSIRTSPLAATVLANAVRQGSAFTQQTAARLVSARLIAGSSIPVERILQRVLPALLASEDRCFIGAFPVLFERHYLKARERGINLLRHGDVSLRRGLIGTLLSMPYYGLELLVEANLHESNLDLQLMITVAIAPALPKTQVAIIARKALADSSPAIRLRGAGLLAYVDTRIASELSRRRDPDPAIDAALRPYRVRKRIPVPAPTA